MDTRVLAAVFITLFAVAIGMQHGPLNVDDVMDSLDRFRGDGLTDLLDRRSTTAANTSVTASLDSSGPVTVSVRSSDLVIALGAGTTAAVGDSTITVDRAANVTVGGFTGTVTASPANVSVAGDATRVVVGGVAFNYSRPKAVDITGPRRTFTLTGIQGQTLTLANATGRVDYPASGEFTGYERARTLVFPAFTGNLTVAGDRSYRLAGKVHEEVRD